MRNAVPIAIGSRLRKWEMNILSLDLLILDSWVLFLYKMFQIKGMSIRSVFRETNNPNPIAIGSSIRNYFLSAAKNPK